jgi:N6-adenosine-specific RNA methylase IME4
MQAARLIDRRDRGVAEQQERRARLEIELGARQCALPDQRCVIYADPPWKFPVYNRGTSTKLADDHYPVMDLDAIKTLAVTTIAASDSVLFLWATAPMLIEAFEVIETWGFSYKSGLVWAKDRIGTGYWTRNKHEHLLIATRGTIPAPAPGTQRPSLIEAPAGRHSEKPAVFYDLIEAYFPTLPKVELFARSARPGWSCWGAEAPMAGADPVP